MTEATGISPAGPHAEEAWPARPSGTSAEPQHSTYTSSPAGNRRSSEDRLGVGMNKNIGIVLLLATLAATSILVNWPRNGRQNYNQGNLTKTVNADEEGINGTGGNAKRREKKDNGSTPSSSSNSDRAGAGSTPLERWTQIKFEKRYATLQILDRGKVECQIHTSPVSVKPLPSAKGEPSPSLWLNYSPSGNAKDRPSTASMPAKEPPQYLIHIHGLMHTGTGYLRDTIYKALANSTYFVEQSRRDGRRTVVSVQNSNWPCRREKPRSSKWGKACWVPQDEGQYLQSVYPTGYFCNRFGRVALKERKANSSGTSPFDERMCLSQLGHVSSLCSLTNDNAEGEQATADGTAKQIGNTLFRQWLPFWEDPSATFLLQKTPTLEALFHERVKVLPAFHLIIVRHPWTSPSWGKMYPTHALDYNIMWAKPYEHIFETLHQGMIEWYAVITYEALVMYEDVVVAELMEIVKSGMRRYSNDRSAKNGSRRLPDRSGRRETDLPFEGQTDRMHRRLHIHRQGKDPTTYLTPKKESMKLWRQCRQNKQGCSKEVRLLTKKVFPFFGFASIAQAGKEMGDPWSTSPLSPSQGIVGVTREFGRVLYTSEAAALRKFRKDSQGEEGSVEEGKDHALDYTPSQELISNLKDIFE